jgi:uncharacterized protein (TIGR00730 family)
MRIAVFAGSSTGLIPGHVLAATRLGETLAGAGITVVYGGGRVGLMGVLADAALRAGGRVIGVMPEHLVAAEIAHPGLTRLVVVDSMHHRKQRMAELADAICALPGGAGTLDELFDIWTWQQLGLHAKPVALVDADGFWRPLQTLLDAMVDDGYLRSEDRRALLVASRIEELLPRIAEWVAPAPKWQHAQVDQPLETVAWVHVQAGRLLTVRSHGRDVCYLPGGKIELGESHHAALRREIREELNVDFEPDSPQPHTVIDAAAHGHNGRRLRMHCYTGTILGEPTPSGEIEDLCWLNDPLDPRCAPTVSKLLRYLQP